MNAKVAIVALFWMAGIANPVAKAELPSEESIRKANSSETQAIIEKSYVILSNTKVFATNCVGAGAAPTASCWALSVIVNHDKDAQSRLAKTFQQSVNPVERLYAIAGLIAIGESKHKRLRPWLFPLELRAAKVEVLDACSFGVSTFGDRVALLFARGSGPYLYREVPAIPEREDTERPAPPQK